MTDIERTERKNGRWKHQVTYLISLCKQIAEQGLGGTVEGQIRSCTLESRILKKRRKYLDSNYLKEKKKYIRMKDKMTEII